MNSKESSLTAIDLFAGCGGLTLGLKQAGFKVLAGVELEPLAARTYQRNHPEARIFNNDIKKLTAPALLADLDLRKGELDLLAGCPPCQGFSRIARKNKIRPARDKRNALILDMLRLVRGLRPKTVLMENVPGLSRHWRFKTLVAGLRRAGYHVVSGTLNAAEFGVPQRRKRLILIASRLGPIELPKGGFASRTVKCAIGKMVHPRRSRDPLHAFTSDHSDRVRELIRTIPRNGGSRLDLGGDNQLPCHRRTDGFKDIYGRMRWDSVAPTITGSCFNPSKGRFLHPFHHRAISLREAALLQAFPKNYRFPSPYEVSRAGVALLIGNALPPRLARAQGAYLRRHLNAASPPR